MTSPSVSSVSRGFRPEGSATRRATVSRYLFLIYFFEVGLVLIVAPWTPFWDRNLFVESGPLVERLLTAHVARGGVSGVGVLNLAAALAEVGVLIGRTHPV